MSALLIDDHALLSDALLTWLSSHLPALRWQAAVSLGQAAETVAEARRAGRPATLILLDLNLEDSVGPATVRRVIDFAPEARILVMSADADPAVITKCLEAGARGFVAKGGDAPQLEAALRCVLSGGIYLPSLAGLDAPRPEGPPLAAAHAPADGPVLTPRQMEVLRCIEQGMSNKAIQRELGMSEGTLKSHLRQMFDRLEVSNRTEAVSVARRQGLFGH